MVTRMSLKKFGIKDLERVELPLKTHAPAGALGAHDGRSQTFRGKINLLFKGNGLEWFTVICRLIIYNKGRHLKI